MTKVDEKTDMQVATNASAADTQPDPMDEKVAAIASTNDIGASMYAQAQTYHSENIEAERAQVKKKLDRILMPVVSIHRILHSLLCPTVISPSGLSRLTFAPADVLIHVSILGQVIPQLRCSIHADP